MEFNIIANNNEGRNPVINTSEERVEIHSPSRGNVSSYKDALKIKTELSPNNMINISHDVRDAKAKFGRNNIKSSLVTIYGENGRIAMSSKEMETLAIPVSEFPAKLEYNLTVMENSIPVEYKVEYNIPTKNSTAVLTAIGKYESAKSSSTLTEAVQQLDDQIVNVKNILYDFSSIYDINEKKVLSLHDFILNLSNKIDKISKDINEIREKKEEM